MKLISYARKEEKRLGLWVDGKAYDVAEQGKKFAEFPTTMKSFLEESEKHFSKLQQLDKDIQANPKNYESVPNPKLLAPVPLKQKKTSISFVPNATLNSSTVFRVSSSLP